MMIFAEVGRELADLRVELNVVVFLFAPQHRIPKVEMQQNDHLVVARLGRKRA